ncbi:phosphoribosylanthranilate isomerase [Thiomicrospira sp. R3]|uniref:phosphoribosylanthranilate isomerase n=1 Tax=Thiomicrospira sp. R3 TaxID=3035472 RepID=UPI00259B9333|nr:phosphoribosylanthranilate isomerase [Thiomicrospira sp. R3]WFE68058.1 phosphoribosylanthranilate isomerase [Thiomicrospira sp. R3]
MTYRTRVKICGITRVDDVLAAANAGADALGLVFYPPSPRSVSVAEAVQLVKNLPAFVTTTALFVDPHVDLVEQVINEVKVDLLQFHGQESAAFCRQFSRPYIKAIAMQSTTDLSALAETYHDAKGLLLDTYKPGVPGGTGEMFNWQWVPSNFIMPLILAGGLTPDNVAQAIQLTGVWAVDVSGGVEASKGIKSAEKVQQFINQAHA